MSFPLPYVLVLLTYPVVPPSCPVRLPAVSSFAACPFCLLAFVSSRLSFRLSTRRAKRLAMCVRRLLAITTVVRMSCGCRAAAGSSVRSASRPPIATSCDTDGGEGNEAIDAIVACFFRISPAMREFCGSRYLRLPGVLRHGILSMCRRGRMSTVAVHRNSLTCFSIPISAPIFASSPSSTLIAV